MSIYKVGQQKRENSKQVYVHKGLQKQGGVPRVIKFG